MNCQMPQGHPSHCGCNDAPPPPLNDKQKLDHLLRENAKLRERCFPSFVVMIGDTGHYVSEAVFNHIVDLRTKLLETSTHPLAVVIQKLPQ